jgi:hypothetical protein
MKQSLLLGVALLLLAACGQEEPTPAAVEEQPAAEEQLVDEASDSSVADETDTAEEILEVVEESAAEPETGEQAILLAQADVPTAPREWQFKEGTNYTRLVPTQPTVGGADKIEVAEFFYYLCPHCFNFEPFRALDQRLGRKQASECTIRSGSRDVEPYARSARAHVLHQRNPGPQWRHRGWCVISRYRLPGNSPPKEPAEFGGRDPEAV